MSSLLNDYTPTVYLTGTIKKIHYKLSRYTFLINNFSKKNLGRGGIWNPRI